MVGRWCLSASMWLKEKKKWKKYVGAACLYWMERFGSQLAIGMKVIYYLVNQSIDTVIQRPRPTPSHPTTLPFWLQTYALIVECHSLRVPAVAAEVVSSILFMFIHVDYQVSRGVPVHSRSLSIRPYVCLPTPPNPPSYWSFVIWVTLKCPTDPADPKQTPAYWSAHSSIESIT